MRFGYKYFNDIENIKTSMMRIGGKKKHRPTSMDVKDNKSYRAILESPDRSDLYNILKNRNVSMLNVN